MLVTWHGLTFEACHPEWCPHASSVLAAGKTVTRLQTVGGIDFVYHPPPRQKMPSAATIAGAPINRCAGIDCSSDRGSARATATHVTWTAVLHC